jgi:hypothetical protein
VAYNTTFQAYKSAQLQALDCRPTGQTKTVGNPGDELTFVGIYTAAEAIEVGECIAVVRVPRNINVTEAPLAWSANTGAVIGLGDPFCCGRLLGPIITTIASGNETVAPSGFSCGTASLAFCIKTGATADGCGLGYVYTCETDLVVTNGYGEGSFGIGGGKSGTANGGLNSGVLASGTRIFAKVKGIIVPSPNA